VTDGTCTINDEWQNAALNYALTQIAERAPTKDVLARLNRAAPKKALARKRGNRRS
jgi:hypothetical protein